MASKLTTLSSPFNGNPELIVAIGKLLHFVNFRRSELLPDDKSIASEVELKDQKSFLLQTIDKLNKREKVIMCMRYGLNGYEELTQKEVAVAMNISQSYISRLEKKILHKLKIEMNNNS
jgi:RNA polymerase sigma factor (sigma-70 family)